jgi:hypothetical protein
MFDLFCGALKIGISSQSYGAGDASEQACLLIIGTGKPPVWF